MSPFATIDDRFPAESYSRQLLEAMRAAVFATDAGGRIIFYNTAAANIWGVQPELGKSEWTGAWRLYRLDGTPLPHDQSPMAMALRERRSIGNIEIIAERPDGSRVHLIPHPTLLYDASGSVTGAVNWLEDVTDREHSGLYRLRLAAIVESSHDAVISKDLRGIITSWNQGAQRLFGYRPEDVIGKPITILFPPDHLDEEPGILERIRRGERVEHYETVRRHKDGTLIDISLMVSPIRDENGKIIGASKVARDITELKRAQRQKDLLLREMVHRTRNLLSVAGSLVALSARTAQTPEDTVKAIRERLGALARANDLTLPDSIAVQLNSARITTLRALLQTILAPFAGRADGGSVAANGPDVQLAGSAVTSFALLLHEFATNACKYGSLCAVGGRVNVEWSVANGELLLIWSEQGGPPVQASPHREGFGDALTRAVMVQLGGQITRDWRPEGLTIRLSAPAERLTV
jgi:PAS domain S-box-containing protein